MSYQTKPLGLRGTSGYTQPPRIMLVSATLVALATVTMPAQADTKKATAADTTGVTELQGVTATADKAQPGSNPNADSEAPYKIDRSGNDKFTEPLLNVSKTITVVGKEQLKDSGTTALRDLMRTQPGITLGTGEGGNAQGDRFIIRGFDARGDMFVDGMRDPGVTTREVFSTEQIEIAKGPSSTFAGRGTTGGAVNNVSKQPQATNFARTTITVGDDKRITVDANRVVNDKLKVRANLMKQDSDIAGRNEVFDKRNGVALAADYQASDKVDLLVDYYHLDTDVMPDRGHPWDRSTNAPAAVDRDNFYGIVGRDFQETGADVITGTVDVALSENTKLSSKTRSGETTNDYVVSTPAGINSLTATTTIPNRASTAGFTNKFTGNTTQITHERHVGNTEHTIVAGVEVNNEKVTNQPYVLNTQSATNPTGTPAPALNVLNPDNHANAPAVIGRGDTSLVKADVQSVYVMDTVKLNPKWEVFGGVRHDTFDLKRQARESTYDANSDSEDKTSFVNGHAGVVYKPKENGSIYTSLSTSSNLPGEMFDAGAVDYGGVTPLVAALDKPEENKSIEIGTKWNLANDNVAVNAAVFRTEKKNKIETLGTGATQTAHQSGAVRVQGVEVGVSGNVTPKLSLAGGAVLMDTKVTSSVVPDAVGKDLANVAEKSASIQAKYQATPKVAVGGTVVHTGKIKGGTFAATTGLELPSSNRLDLMGEYKINNKLSTQLNIKNATDETIYEAFYRSTAPFTYVAPGRTTNISLTYDF